MLVLPREVGLEDYGRCILTEVLISLTFILILYSSILAMALFSATSSAVISLSSLTLSISFVSFIIYRFYCSHFACNTTYLESSTSPPESLVISFWILAISFDILVIFKSNLSLVRSTLSDKSGNCFSATSAQVFAAPTILSLADTKCSFYCSFMKRTRSDCLINCSRFCSAEAFASSNSDTFVQYESSSCMISAGCSRKA